MAIAGISILYALLSPIAAVASIVLGFYFKKKVMAAEKGNEKMMEVAGYIQKGARAFLKVQYATLAKVVAVLAVLIGLLYGLDPTPVAPWYIVIIGYLLGSFSSAWAGWIGMGVGVEANSRTAQASTKGLAAAFNVSFFGGAFMGLMVVGAALGGVSILYWITGTPYAVLGFSFGASSIALFAKAGGGIYTKTADVGADLVGKLEFKLPEDDPRNPASIADNVGDNVGDIAGMGADLFDSYVASIIAALFLTLGIARGLTGNATEISTIAQYFSLYPLVQSAGGLLAAVVGIFMVSKLVKKSPSNALNSGTYITTGLFIIISAILTLIMGATAPTLNGVNILNATLWRNFGAGVGGLLSGLMIGMTTDYYTDDGKKPTQLTAAASQQGHAIVILTGFSYGLISVFPPIIGVVIATVISYALAGITGIANAAVGMLAVIGIIVSNDAYGPIVDNARGLAEVGGLKEEEIAICDKLDSAGNTAKAITKGFAIGAAALTVLGLMYSFSEEVEVLTGTAITFNLLEPIILVGAFVGSAIPCIYSAVLIQAVQKNAGLMVEEIRRQFKEKPAILEGKEVADYEKCIAIATKGAIKELTIPVLLAIGSPIVTGLLFGSAALGSFLASSILVGFILAIMMSNAGGMWDNAKKYVEDGHFGGKGSKAHEASITGDTVGDPFKDTAGPSINTLICVLSLTASIFLPIMIELSGVNGWIGNLLV